MERSHNSIVFQKIMRSSLAMLVGMLAILSFDMVDTYYLSKLGTDTLVAISYATPILQTLLSVSIGITISVSVVQGRLLQPDRQHDFRQFSIHSAVIVLCISISIGLFAGFTSHFLSIELANQPTVQQAYDLYVFYWLIAYPFFSLLVVLNQTIRSRGYASVASKVLLFTCVLNVILDPVLVFELELGVIGAPLSSFISYVIGIIISLMFLAERIDIFHAAALNKFWKNFIKLIKRSALIAFSVMIDPLIMAFILMMASGFDKAIVAAITIGIKIDLFMRLFSLSISRVIPTIFGHYFHDNKTALALLTIKQSIKLNLVIYLPLALFIGLLSEQIVNLFTNEHKVIEFAILYLMIVPISYAFKGLSIAIFQYYHSVDKSGEATIINLVLSLCIIISSYLGYLFFDAIGLIVGFSLGCVFYGCAMLIRYYYEPRPI